MGLGLPGASVIQSGANLIGGLVQNYANRQLVKQQNKANFELAKYGYDRDLQMWHMQNLYNQPKAQMQRFAQAGLNPNLIYGQGNAGNATSMPNFKAPRVERNMFTMPKVNALADYQNAMAMQAQIELTKAQKERTEELTATQQSISTIKAIDAELNNARLAFWQTGGRPLTRTYRKTTFNPYGYGYVNLRNAMSNPINLTYQNYQLAIKKQALLDQQIALTYQNLLTKRREYGWMPWEKGVGLGAKAITGIGGAYGLGKLGSAGGKIINMNPKAPKLKSTLPRSFRGKSWNDVYTKYRLPTLNKRYGGPY